MRASGRGVLRPRAGRSSLALMAQVVDTGLDYSSCYFIDEDGEEVRHGHYYEEVGFPSDSSFSSSTSKVAVVFEGGDFHADLDRRKVGRTP